ncbi:MAG: response regulator [Betaproteobacteria bacterium]|nr:response regulator [Betaproteobacteria bacterium]
MKNFLTFMDGPLQGTILQAEYAPELVALSYVVAAFAAYTALDFTARVHQSSRLRGSALAWLAGGATAMGSGIWGMHFIGMLAWRLPLPVAYDVSITLASLAVAIVLSGFALSLVSRKALPTARLLGGGILMGLGVVTMHYTGMAAIHMEAMLAYSRGWFTLSVLNAIVCSTVALWLVFRIGAATTSLRNDALKVAAALFMGFAIAGMHYTAMYAGVCTSAQPVGDAIAPIDPGLQRLVVIGVALLIGSVVAAVWVQNRVVSSRQRASERRLALIMDNVPAMIAYVDAAERYGFVNKAFAQWVGCEQDDIIGRKTGEVRQNAGHADIGPDPEHGLHGLAPIELLRLRKGKRIRYERHAAGAGGQDRYADIELLPELDDAGIFKGYYLLATEVTHRKAAEEDLRAAKDAAENADRTKSRFLASMSHEIRTPMNGVLGMAELLLGTHLDERQRRFADAIHRSGNALLGIINDILDFSKIEAGRLELDRAEFDLHELCGEVIALLAEAAQAKKVRLVCDFDPALPHAFVGDPLRIRQILTNLVGNAAKFTERGSVTVEVRPAPPEMLRTPPEEGECGIYVSVRDTGIGMDDETIQRLFTAFTQADASMTRRFGGTGLGLAISKQLAEMMGGAIGAQSRPGEGSTFWFTLCLGAAAAGANRPLRDAQLAGLRALIVEDNPTNRSILEHQLSVMGMRLDATHNGERALELLRTAAASGSAYDLALVDRRMPRMDGVRLVEEIRREPALSGLKTVMLSSPDCAGEITEARAAGVDAYLVKPVSFPQLARTVRGVFGMADNPAPELQARPQTIFRGVCVLLAEDNFVNREIGVAMLEALGCAADCAGNGREAVAEAAARYYDLVLMDCQMPELDGFAATSAIREREAAGELPAADGQPAPRRLPIVALTANAMRGDRERCLQAGMDDYLAKPFSQDQLRELLERWVQPRDDEGTSTDAAHRGEVAVEGPVLDPAALDAIRELQRPGQPQLVARIVGAYHEESPRLLSELKRAAQAQDSDALARAAHSLRSSSANLGASRLAVLCKQLESSARDERLAGAEGLLEALENEYRKVSAALREAA